MNAVGRIVIIAVLLILPASVSAGGTPSLSPQYQDAQGRILGELNLLSFAVDPSKQLAAEELRSHGQFVERFGLQDQYRRISGIIPKLAHDPNTEVVLFRGQNQLTETVLAPKARREGVAGARESLEKLLNHLEKELADSKDLTPLDTVINDYVTGAADEHFVATSDDLEVAMGDFALGGPKKYVYVLVAPKNVAVPRWRVRQTLSQAPGDIGSQEREYSIPYEASSYVRAVFDVGAKKFVFKKPGRT